MTDDRSLERAARSFIENGPTRAPEHAVQAALGRIQTTPQERDLRVPWRLPKMTTPARIAAAAVIGVLAIGGAALLLGRSPQPQVGSPSQTPTPSIKASPSSTAGAGTDYSTTPGWIVFEHWGWAIDGTSADFSPDFRQIWLVHADGTNLHELAPGKPEGKTSPDVAPDGKTVIFASWGPLSRIWQAPIDGSDATQVAIDCPATGGSDCKQDDPAYSPDGKMVAFVRTQTTPTTMSSEIAIHDIGSGQTRLIDTTLVTDGILGQPTWSPNGLQLAYHHDTQAGPEQRPTRIRIEVVKVDGTNLHELPAPAGEAKAGDPDWSPDGSLIVFSTMPNREGEGDGTGSPGIYTIHPDGSGLNDVCGDCLAGGIAPTWTPDGKHILFWGYRTWAMMLPDGRDMAHINPSKLTWFGDGHGYSYFAVLQPPS